MAQSKPKLFLLTVIIIACGITLRAVHIDADTPSGLSWSAGLYVDEGYKTLSPRNLCLFGETHWHPADTYPGWMTMSPLTQWPVYAAFKILNVDISSARVVPITFFTLLMLLFAYFLGRRYGPKLYFAGLLLLIIDASLFTFSRVALFEITLSFFFYSLILPLSLLGEAKQSSLRPTIWLVTGGLAIAFLIKLSTLVYLAPALIAVYALFIFKRIHLSRRHSILLLFIFSLVLLGLLVVTHHLWSTRLGISPLAYVYKIIDNPLRVTSPAILIAGTLCAAHIVAYQSRLYFTNVYRASLLCMVVTAPFILSLFPYNPLRYYIPFVPAYILLILEWFHTTTDERYLEPRHYIGSAIGLLLAGFAIAYTFTALELHEHIQMRMIIVISACLVFILWYFRRKFFSTSTARLAIASFAIISVLHSVFLIGSFLSNPMYDSEGMRDRLRQIVKDTEVVSGGWAPFLTLGTPIRVIYASTDFNPPASLKVIQPNYFLLSETPTAMKTFEIIQNDRDICPGAPFDLGSYNKTRVMLFPLSYNVPCDKSGPSVPNG